jgi:hypothetical protein
LSFSGRVSPHFGHFSPRLIPVWPQPNVAHVAYSLEAMLRGLSAMMVYGGEFFWGAGREEGRGGFEERFFFYIHLRE